MNLDSQTQSLLVSAKLGNEEAITALFARYQARILRIVRLRLSPGLRAKLKLQSMDIVQEVFMKAFHYLKDFEPKSQGHFLNWLAKMAEQYICDRLDYVSTLKRDAPEGEISLDQDASQGTQSAQMREQVADDGTTPSQFVIRKDRETLLDSMLDLLDPEQKELIIHRDLEEMTFAEIGGLMGKSEEAVRKQYSRAMKRLIDLSEEKLKPIISEDTFRNL